MSLASKKLNISQQGLSRQIQSLEKVLDGILFERSHSGVTLTNFGKEVRPLLESSINNYEEIIQISKKHKNKKDNVIKLAFAQAATTALGLEFISSFNKLYPDISIEIFEFNDEDCYSSLLTNEVDFAFITNPFDTSKVKHTTVFCDLPFAAINNAHGFATTKTTLEKKKSQS